MNFITYSLVFGYFIFHNLHGLDLFHPEIDSIKKYEILSAKIEFDKKNQDKSLKREFVLIKFGAFGKNFHLSLHRDQSVLSTGAKVFIHGNRKILKTYIQNIPEAFIYEGIVTGKNESSVIGYFFDNVFVGSIHMDKEIYYLEPASIHLKHEIYREKIIVYNGKDSCSRCVFKHGKNISEQINDKSFLKRKSCKHFYSHFYTSNVSVQSTKFTKNRRTCSIELLADHTFSQYLNFNRGKIIGEMLSRLKAADRVIRNLDLNEDGYPDNIGFIVEKITIFENKDEPNYPLAIETDDDDLFLWTLTKYNHPYCVLICFSYRFFCRPYCALSHTFNFNKDNILNSGGICRSQLFNSKKNDRRNYNVGFVNDGLKYSMITENDKILSLLRILGKALGSRDDPINDRICSPGDFDITVGNYIMHPQYHLGDKPNHWKFSPCSLKSINEFLKIKGFCLKTVSKSTCGNGITEEGEACDCGNSTICQEVDKCCNPNSCTLAKTCSPKESQCCTKYCNVDKLLIYGQSKRCFVNKPCMKPTVFCDRKSPFCPEIFEQNGTPCLGTSRTCRNGNCISNVCEDHGLKLCQCSHRFDECHVCCKNGTNACKTAKQLNIVISDDQFYIKIPGTNCDNKHGICSNNGTCVMKNLWPKHPVWIYFYPLPYVLIIILAILAHKIKREITPDIVIMARRYRQKAL